MTNVEGSKRQAVEVDWSLTELGLEANVLLGWNRTASYFNNASESMQPTRRLTSLQAEFSPNRSIR